MRSDFHEFEEDKVRIRWSDSQGLLWVREFVSIIDGHEEWRELNLSDEKARELGNQLLNKAASP